MDIFKQKRYLTFLIVLLVIMNAGTLALLWTGRPSNRPASHVALSPDRKDVHMERLLKKELGFDKNQIEQYLNLRQKHRNQVQKLRMEIRQIKKQMFDEVFKENPQSTLSDSLLKLTQEKQAEIEQITFRHFLDLKRLCKPEQQGNLKLLIGEFFRQENPTGKEAIPPPPPRQK